MLIDSIMKELSLKRTWTPLTACVGFIGTLALVRVYTYLKPASQFWISDIHVHHMNYGILLIILSAAFGIYYMGARMTELSSLLFGVGLGLVVDEWGNLLIESWHFEDYWGLGRNISFTIAAGVGALLVFIYSLRKHKASEDRFISERMEAKRGIVIGPDMKDSDWFARLVGDKTKATTQAVRIVAPRLFRFLGIANTQPEERKHFEAFVVVGDLERIYREGHMILVEADAVLVENPTDIWDNLQQSMKLTGKSFGDLLREELHELKRR